MTIALETRIVPQANLQTIVLFVFMLFNQQADTQTLFTFSNSSRISIHLINGIYYSFFKYKENYVTTKK